MALLADHARQRNNSNVEIVPLLRPQIERAVDCDGFCVLRGNHGWLFGDRRQALAEFARLERIERSGRAAR